MLAEEKESLLFENKSVYLIDVIMNKVIIIEEYQGLKILGSHLETIHSTDIFKPTGVYSHPLEKASVISVFRQKNSANILLYEHGNSTNEHFVYFNLKTFSSEVIPIACNLYEDDEFWEIIEQLYVWKNDTLFFIDENDIFYALSLETRLTVPVKQKWIKENLKEFYDAFLLYKEYGLASKVYVEEKKFIYRVKQDEKYYAVAVDCATKEQEVLYEGDYYWFRMEQSSRFWLFISYEAIEVVDRFSGQVNIIYPEKHYDFSFSKFINENTFVSSQWRHCNPCTTILKTHSIHV